MKFAPVGQKALEILQTLKPNLPPPPRPTLEDLKMQATTSVVSGAEAGFGPQSGFFKFVGFAGLSAVAASKVF